MDIFLYIQRNNPTNYYLPLISVISGLFGVFLGYWLREITEDYQEEFFALQTTVDLLDADPSEERQRNIINFYNELRLNLRARRLNTFDLMKAILKMALGNDDSTREEYVKERSKIDSRLEDLKKRGRTHRAILIIKDSFSR
ncbi:hypothetical protein [Methanosaeta sp. UBA458]|jgi:hypothetical protein|uniref:hypothetical protein n=1 Tax=Methanosaeta sp. UBA458 TaxID=1915561 RepID=UPI00257EE68C|nr:hypothetical protein [Methanosaeta sp. UBA458]